MFPLKQRDDAKPPRRHPEIWLLLLSCLALH